MCSPLLLLPLLLLSGSANAANVFVFEDLPGFERCLQTDNIVERSKTGGAEQVRYLEPHEVQQRCITAAAKLLGPKKDKDADMAFIASAKKLSQPENALDLSSVLVDHGLSGCNELSAYEVLTRSLSRSQESSPAYFSKARAIVKRCLKDDQFKADFLEEKDRGSELGANACEILREEKLVKACPRKQP